MTGGTSAAQQPAIADAHLFQDLRLYTGTNLDNQINFQFNSKVLDYNISVPAGVDRLKIGFTLFDSKDLVSFNEGNSSSLAGDSEFKDVWYLSYGKQTRTFRVISSEDITVQHTYTLNVTRENKGTLADLKLNVGDPFTFQPHVLNYSASVKYNIDQVVINYTRNEAKSKVKLNGGDDNGDTASQPLILNYGNNKFTVEVTSEDGTADNVYSIYVYREYPPVAGDKGEVPAISITGTTAELTVESSDRLNINLYSLFGLTGYGRLAITNDEGEDLGNDATNVKVDVGTTTVTALGSAGDVEATYTVIIKKPLEMLDGTGSGQAHATGSAAPLSFHCNGDDQKYTGIKVDGKDATKYATASHGSTIVTLDNGFLDTLEPGSHTLTIEYGKYKDENFRSIDSTFVITKQQKAQTTDHYWLITYLDNNGNTVSVQWVKNGESPVKPAGYNYPDISNVTSNQDVRPIGGASASGRISVPNTADTGD